MNAVCEGALISKSGGRYLPWGPYLAADHVRRLRVDLFEMIEALATLEAWPHEYRDDVLTRAVRGPLYDLQTNVRYFEKRLIAAQCAVGAAELRDMRVWHGEGFEDRMTDREPKTWNTTTASIKARGTVLDRIANRVRRKAR